MRTFTFNERYLEKGKSQEYRALGNALKFSGRDLAMGEFWYYEVLESALSRSRRRVTSHSRSSFYVLSENSCNSKEMNSRHGLCLNVSILI